VETPIQQPIATASLPAKPDIFAPANADEIKRKSVRGGAISLVAQALRFVLRTGSVIVLARLLSPEDFGLQGMVAAVLGFLGIFRDAGLSVATVQRNEITHQQISALFWTNVAVGAALTGIGVLATPGLVAFYKEPRLYWVSVVSVAAFLLNGLGIQHQALLQRNMQYFTIAVIDLVALLVSLGVGIGMALGGLGYWALVGMAVSAPFVSTLGAWIAIPWMPGIPRRGSGIRSMLHFGGTCTLNSLVVYAAYNVEKVLLGRFWGAEALGLYGRAYQLVTLPIEQLNSSINGVAFPALSRIQHDPERLCRAFLKGYAILSSISLPITLMCAVFAEEIVRVVLGQKWMEAAPIFRLLVPTAMTLALVNPFGWFMQATGRAVRSLCIALLIAPVVLLGILLGLHHGPKGVALGYSLAMASLVLPIITWAKRGTGITMKSYWESIKPLVFSCLLASIGGLLVKVLLIGKLATLPLLILETVTFGGVYAWFLLIVMRQKSLYLDLLAQVFPRLRRSASSNL